MNMKQLVPGFASVLAATCWAAGPAWALNAKLVPNTSNIYGFDQASDNDMLVADLNALIGQNAGGKVVIFGGVHGYENTGVPTAARNQHYPCAEITAEEADIKKNFQTKYKRAPSFAYVDVKKLQTPGQNGDFSDKSLNSIYQSITRQATGGVVSYIAWCWGGTWYQHGGGH
jgi:hypothetical protein